MLLFIKYLSALIVVLMAINVFQEILQMNAFSAFVTEWRWEKKEMSIIYPVTQRLADFLIVNVIKPRP